MTHAFAANPTSWIRGALLLLGDVCRICSKPRPTHPVDGEYIKEWLVLGPIPSEDFNTDFLTDVGGEANINP